MLGTAVRIGLGTAAAVGLVAADLMAVAPQPTAVRPAAASRPGGALLADAIHVSTGLVHAADATPRPLTTAQCRADLGISCYGAPQVQRAYGLPALYRSGVRGRGATIVIVDSFGSPTVAKDLAVFDRVYGLPAPPSLKIIQPAGRVAPYQPTGTRTGWAGETELDVEWSHAIAPRANIVLVETPVSEEEGRSGFPQIVRAEKYVVDHHLGGVISQSFSATEESFANAQEIFRLRGAYKDAARNGVTVLAAAGDSGAADVHFNEVDYYLRPVTSWPDSDPLVTGVGGTQLHLGAAGHHLAPDSVWNDTFSRATQRYIFGDNGPNPLAGGGGKSVIFARPRWQNRVRRVVGHHRGVPDIAMSGACNGAVNMYQSFRGQPAGWYPTCGTSEATPLFAGIVALADQVAGHPLGTINRALYAMRAAHARGLIDVRRGNIGVRFRQRGRLHTIAGFRALRGYDLASGVGTVRAKPFVRELAARAG